MKHTSAQQIRGILSGTGERNLDYPTFLSRRQDDTYGGDDRRSPASPA